MFVVLNKAATHASPGGRFSTRDKIQQTVECFTSHISKQALLNGPTESAVIHLVAALFPLSSSQVLDHPWAFLFSGVYEGDADEDFLQPGTFAPSPHLRV